MGGISKGLSLLLIVILALTILIRVESVSAQSVPKPSVPEFTAKFMNASYSVTTTNLYTGVNETQLISNNSIEITINNQPLENSNYKIYYNIRAKPHFAENWTEVYATQNRTSSYIDGTFYYAQYINPDSSPHSKSSYITISFPVVPTEYYSESGYDIKRYYTGDEGQEGRYFAFLHGIPDNAQIDFQVDALVGQNATYWYVQHPLFPQYGGFYRPTIAYDSDSGWSSTQTIIIGEISASPTPTPTTPEFPSWTIPLLLSLMVATAALLVSHKKHKHNLVQNP